MSTHAPLRFVNFLAFNANPLYIAICQEVERILGTSTVFAEGETLDQFLHDEFDVGYVCGLPYSKMVRRADAPFELLVAPVRVGKRYAGRAVYFSDVIVHKESSFYTLDDLHGCTFTYNEPISYSGYHVVKWHLAQQGRDETFFGPWVQSGQHVRSIAAVANRRADAAAIDCQALSTARQLDPRLNEQLRVIETIGPSPHPPVVVGRLVSAEVKAKLRDIYLNLHNNPAMQPILATDGIERFVAVDDADYDTIRRRVDTTHINFVTS